MNSNNNILLNIINNSIDIIDTNNLPINNRVELDSDNVYKDLKVDILIHQSISYLMAGNDIPKDMKDALNYYGIIDHFYPDTDSDDLYVVVDPERVTATEVRAVREGRLPVVVRSEQESEQHVCAARQRTRRMQEAIAKRAGGNVRTIKPIRSDR